QERGILRRSGGWDAPCLGASSLEETAGADLLAEDGSEAGEEGQPEEAVRQPDAEAALGDERAGELAGPRLAPRDLRQHPRLVRREGGRVGAVLPVQRLREEVGA